MNEIISVAGGVCAAAGFQATGVAAGIKKGREDLVEGINGILAGISEEERTEIMDNAIVNQPAAEAE